MSFGEALRVALNGLVTNRLRAALTTLGIIIGVGAVITLVSIGQGVEDFIASEFERLGSNVIFVFSSQPDSQPEPGSTLLRCERRRCCPTPALRLASVG